MDHDDYPDLYLRDILTNVRTIAVVGASPRRERPSHRVMAYLQRRGYRAIPVNPNAAGGKINGETCYARLADVPEPIDMVDVFRRTEMAGGVVDEVMELLEQAVAVRATTMAPAIARPVAGWNLIASLRESRSDMPVAAGLLAFIVCPAGVALLRPMRRLPTRASGERAGLPVSAGRAAS